MDGTIRLDRGRNQWRADVAVSGVRRRKRFSATTPESVMRAWISEQLESAAQPPEPPQDALALWNEKWTAFTQGRKLPSPARGISWTIHGWRLQVMRNCRLSVKSFPKHGPMSAMSAWLEERRPKATAP